jgi:AraC-like DNA-binding protein
MGRLSLARRSLLRRRFQRLNAWIAANLKGDLSVPALADRALMSPTSFARAYREVMGVTPAKAVLRLRTAAAARLLTELSDSPLSVAQIAYLCGLGGMDSFRRCFRREFGMSPDVWREWDDATRPGGPNIMTGEERGAYIESIIQSVNQRVLELKLVVDQYETRRVEQWSRLDQRLDRLEERQDKLFLQLDQLLGQLQAQPAGGGGGAKTKAA